MSDEWGPWIEHDGQGCPCPGEYCQMVFEGPVGVFEKGEGVASTGGYSWDWSLFNWQVPGGGIVARILRYRIRKPRALRQLREIAASVPAPARQREHT